MEKISSELTSDKVLATIKEVIETLSPSVTKSISTIDGIKVSAYRMGSKIVRIDINKQT